MTEKHKKVIGRVECDLDGRFSQVRTRETNLGKQRNYLNANQPSFVRGTKKHY